jgi:hypothetical protein
MRRWLALIFGGLTLLIAGYRIAQSSSVTGTTITVAPPSPAADTPSTTTTSTVAASRVISAAAPDPRKPPDFVLTGQTAEGDKVRVEGRFGPALPPARTDANQTALGVCAQADGRELIARLDLTTTIQSSLAGSVALKGFIGGSKNMTEFLMGYTEGPRCDTEVELGTLQPYVPHSFTLWVILGKAITPNDPHPSAKELGQGWGMEIPTISVNNTRATRGIAAGGPRVIDCKPRSSEVVAGTVASSSSISITGTPAYTLTVQEAASEYRLSCTKVPTP